MAGHRNHSLVLLGLPATASRAKLWVRGRKTAGALALTFPAVLPGSQRLAAAVLRYDSKPRRDAALKRFEGHVVLGAAVRARAGEAVLAPPEAFSKARIILRNLPFDATAAHVVGAAARHGAAHALCDVLVPRKGGADSANRGFAF